MQVDGGELGLEVQGVEEREQLVDVDEGVVVALGEDGGDAGLGVMLGRGEGLEGGDGAGGAFFVGEGHHSRLVRDIYYISWVVESWHGMV